MINIKGFPLLHEDECNDLFSSEDDFTGYYFVKPIYKYLPDKDSWDGEEKDKFNNVREGLYLVGLEIISDRWVNKGFCLRLLESYGLVLDEANPMVKKGDRGDEDSFIYLNFNHICFAVHLLDVSVDS